MIITQVQYIIESKNLNYLFSKCIVIFHIIWQVIGNIFFYGTNNTYRTNNFQKVVNILCSIYIVGMANVYFSQVPTFYNQSVLKKNSLLQYFHTYLYSYEQFFLRVMGILISLVYFISLKCCNETESNTVLVSSIVALFLCFNLK